MSDINSDEVRNSVAAAFADFPEEDITPTVVAEPSVSHETDESEVETSADSSEERRARDEKGRFAKAEQQKAVAAETKVSAPAQKDIDQSGELAEEAQAAPILPPNSWSTEEKAKFASLPADVKEVITRREKERDSFIFQKSEELSRAQRRYSEIDELIGPREQQLRLAGMTPAAYLHQVMAGADMLDANPVGAIRHFINHYGIQPQQLFNGQSQQVDQYQLQLNQLRQELQMRDERAQQNVHQQFIGGVEREIQSFRNEADSKGAPVRPFFDSVAPHINSLIPQIRSENPALSVREVLNQAYDQAIYANPRVRSEVLKMERAAQETKNVEDAKRRVAEARNRGGSISGAPSGNSVQSTNGIRSIVESAFGEFIR